MIEPAALPTGRLALGRYPTPVEPMGGGGMPRDLWVKRDDLTDGGYGGNKVRKLERLLADASDRGAKRLVTIGAAGSHHVLATTYFARRAGFDVDAVLFPQPATAHVEETLRAGLALGMRPHAAPSPGWAAIVAAARVLGGAHLVPPGGSSVVGALGYVDAARELAEQVRRGELPEPDWCVVALGSGGTAAGLAAGFAAERMKTRVVAVCILTPVWLARVAAVSLARACARRIGSRSPAADVRAHLVVEDRFVGHGYGYPTDAGERATLLAAQHAGLSLDPTYTAKAFARAVGLGAPPLAGTVLYWHTLSSAPVAPLLAAGDSTLSPSLLRLMRR